MIIRLLVILFFIFTSILSSPTTSKQFKEDEAKKCIESAECYNE